MKIKEDKQLKPGDVIKWNVRPVTEISHSNGNPTETFKKTVKIMVKAVYPHYVEFKILEPPFLTINITNNELYQKGIYQSTDFINPFARV